MYVHAFMPDAIFLVTHAFKPRWVIISVPCFFVVAAIDGDASQ